MHKISPSVFAMLQNDHRGYGDINQKPRSDCTLMAAHGHPATAEYQALRAFFDTLLYASNASARHFSYKNKLECAEYWAPTLDMGWYPQDELRHFGHVYPADPRWEEYIVAAGKAGWPPGVEARLEGGSWIIRTQSQVMRDRFAELKAKLDKKGRFSVKTELDMESNKTFYSIEISLFDVDGALALQKNIVGILKKHQKNYILPERTPSQDAADTAELPLSEKKFMLGNVEAVTVTARHVLVPLIALPADENLMLKHCNDLEKLCLKGLPFAQVKDWLSKILTPTCLRSMQEKYA